MKTRWQKYAILAVALGLLVASCGDDDAEEATTSTSQSTVEDPIAELYAAAQEEGELVIYTAETAERMEAILSGFELKYPGIKTDFVRADTRTLQERIGTEFLADQSLFDAFTLTDRRVELLNSEIPGSVGTYSPMNSEILPTEMQSDTGLYATYAINLAGLAYNTGCFEEAPTSYEVILNPEWEGQIVMQDPLGGGGIQSWVFFMRDVFDTDEEWISFFQQLAAQNPIYESYIPAQNALAAGSACLMPGAYPDYIQPLADAGAPVAWAPVEPMMLTNLTVSLYGKPMNPNAARLFMEYMLSEEAQRLMGSLKLLPAVPEYRPAVFAATQDLELIANPWREVESNREFYDDALNDMFGG